MKEHYGVYLDFLTTGRLHRIATFLTWLDAATYCLAHQPLDLVIIADRDVRRVKQVQS